MPFKNKGASRDDKSKNQRSNLKNFKSKGGPHRKSANSYKSSDTSRSSNSDDLYSKPHGKPSKFSSTDRPFKKTSTEGTRNNKRPYAADRPYTRESTEGARNSKRPYAADRPYTRESTEGARNSKRPYAADRPYTRESTEGARNSKRPYAADRPYTRESAEGARNNKRPYAADRPYTKESAYAEQRKNNDFKYTANRKFRPANKPATKQNEDDGLIRLNRYIANSGVCSRRKADELIAAGVISVNGEVTTELGTRIDPYKDDIRYNNERLKREKMIYVLLNKPKDYITTTDDPQERRTVMQLVEKASKERIYPVGRLDRNTTGLLLLTNDGNLADKLSHPKNGITKIYQVELNKSLTQGDFNKIQFGLELEDGLIKPDDISYVVGASKREIGIQIHSGKNRIVRRIFESLGYDVIKLDRVVYANLTKKNLPRGRWRYLEEKELTRLKHFI